MKSNLVCAPVTTQQGDRSIKAVNHPMPGRIFLQYIQTPATTAQGDLPFQQQLSSSPCTAALLSPVAQPSILPNLESKSVVQLPPVFGLRSSQIRRNKERGRFKTQREIKMEGSFDLQPYQKSPLFSLGASCTHQVQGQKPLAITYFIRVYNTLPKNPYENWQIPAIKSLGKLDQAIYVLK